MLQALKGARVWLHCFAAVPPELGSKCGAKYTSTGSHGKCADLLTIGTSCIQHSAPEQHMYDMKYARLNDAKYHILYDTAGFSFWVPATIKTLVLCAGKQAILTLEIRSWGNQHGLNFDLRDVFTNPSTFDVLLPREESAVWFNEWGPSALFAANTMKWADNIESSSALDWDNVPTPAYFAEILPDDSSRWGLHGKTLEEMYLPAHAPKRKNGRVRGAVTVHGNIESTKPTEKAEGSDVLLSRVMCVRYGAYDLPSDISFDIQVKPSLMAQNMAKKERQLVPRDSMTLITAPT
jgi:hypothetical protein